MKGLYQLRLAQFYQWVDVLLLNGTFMSMYLLRFMHSLPHNRDQYLIMMLAGNLLWLFIGSVLGTYRIKRLDYTLMNQVEAFTKAALVHAGTLMMLLYLVQWGEDISRLFLLSVYLGFMATSLTVRIASLFVIQQYRRVGFNAYHYVVVGDEMMTEQLRLVYDQQPELGYRCLGTFEIRPEHSIQTEVDRLDAYLQREQPDFLYCCLNNLSPQQTQEVIRLAERNKTQIRLVPDFRGFLTHQARIEYHGVFPLIEVSTKPFSNVQEESLKRVFDLTFSAVVMILGLPIFLLVMLAVKLSSPGPIFFTQERSGRWGKIFKIYKFRTMYANADSFGLQHSQGDKDPRITPIGLFLRRSRLDELPQFFNVLKGDMSVVGPRPLPYYDVEMLMKEVPHDFRRLLTVKPGITSIGQIEVGYASNLAENVKRLRCDMQYLTQYSLRQDIRLILLTVQVMILGRGK
ncbi:undecaprenyl-phosphate glucose phosphotransferase [Rhabdobacter roseus]|uniref:Putative colanic acid biosynthesis UDP-glucose lipid carrier transferase n=1 Tax=Rhabdobacter roseus TaxID=1655419 RepID=A0A840TQS6_9BACT|nr:sugar transferase [Rhabdobacter roseus]MBB5286686.1 putative colanic acid biosynthesis UDP-glucose lipid carrier transferase [Rhabdobacter roseus]